MKELNFESKTSRPIGIRNNKYHTKRILSVQKYGGPNSEKQGIKLNPLWKKPK